MSDYRRCRVPGGTYFFTLVAAGRWPWLGRPAARDLLTQVMREVRREHPFETLGLVVLPDHLHAIWRLPEGDDDFRGRWHRIRQRTTLRLRAAGAPERRFWQPRFWEHLVRDDRDLRLHLDYIHYNPVKHGWVSAPVEWPASTFHRYVALGVYPVDWGGPVERLEVPE